MAESPMELADGERAVCELGEQVRLGLGHSQRGAVEVERDEMDSSFQVLDHYGFVLYDMVMTDDELLAAFEAGEIEPAEFPHELHVRTARLLSLEPDGLERMRAGIRTIAERAGRPENYHETITRAWFELISRAERLGPELHDRGLLARYYSAQALASGRETWDEPDLNPLRLPAPPNR